MFNWIFRGSYMSCLSILMHGVISVPDATSYDKLFEYWWTFVLSAEQTYLCYFGKGKYVLHFCETIFIFGPWFKGDNF